jgi:hypothetical protein
MAVLRFVLAPARADSRAADPRPRRHLPANRGAGHPDQIVRSAERLRRSGGPGADAYLLSHGDAAPEQAFFQKPRRRSMRNDRDRNHEA